MEEMYWRILLEIQRQRHMLLIVFETKEQNNQVEEDEMGGSCSTYGGEEERV
jgi:hypothetical protein